MKRELPQLVAFLSGLVMVLAYFVPTESFRILQDVLANWVGILLAFSSFLAMASLIGIHGERISRKSSGYAYSMVTLLSLFVTILAGFFYGVDNYYPDYVVVESAQAQARIVAAAERFEKGQTTVERDAVLDAVLPTVGADLGVTRRVTLARNLETLAATIRKNRADKRPPLDVMPSGPLSGKVVLPVSYYNLFQWLYDYVYSPLFSTMFSILAFYVASAAFRAFRARTVAGTLLLLSAFLVMLGRVPIGYEIYRRFPWFPLPAIADWLMSVMNTAGQRAIMIGAALGIVSASLRMLLGLEQTYLGGD
jgi:hypothetical protein